jgi:hypothetical protein
LVSKSISWSVKPKYTIKNPSKNQPIIFNFFLLEGFGGWNATRT